MIEDKFPEVKRKRAKRRKSVRKKAGKTTSFNVEELAKICLPKTEKGRIA